MKKLIVAAIAALSTMSAQAVNLDMDWDEVKSVNIKMSISTPYLNQYGNPWDSKIAFVDPNGLPDLITGTRSDIQSGERVFYSSAIQGKSEVPCKNTISCDVYVAVGSEHFILVIYNKNAKGPEPMKRLECHLKNKECIDGEFKATNFKIVGVNY